MLNKFANLEITPKDVRTSQAVLDEIDSEVLERFQKIASELKVIAPKAKDFLYFNAVMMHAAERVLIDENGSIRTTADGTPLEAYWIKKGDSWKWECNDPTVNPFKNANNDIFPEEELIKHHKKWVGKPLCLDHKSGSVDFIRGVIVDTYYDRKMKRVIALCALDKVNYPDLARKVETGYATSVSMGTAVGKAICTDCGKVARIEADFCDHMRNKNCYGEINVDLNPLELSIVVNGADPYAKIRHIVASAESISQYVELKEANKQSMGTQEYQELKSSVDNLREELKKLESSLSSEAPKDTNEAYGQPGQGSLHMTETDLPNSPTSLASPVERLASQTHLVLIDLQEKLSKLINKFDSIKTAGENAMTEKKGYFQGGGGLNEPAPKQVKYPKEDEDSIRNNEDKQMVGQMETGPVDGMHPGYDSFGESEEARKKRLQRLAQEQHNRELRRTAALNKAKEAIEKRKQAYHQGGGGPNDPANLPYPKEDEDSIRNKEDKQMVGQKPFPGVGSVDGLHPSPESADVKDELKRKQMLSRAKLNAKFMKVANPDGSLNLGESHWQVYADAEPIMSVSVEDVAGEKVDALYDTVATKEFGKKLIRTIKTEGYDKACSLFKKAQAVAGPGALPAAPPDASGGAAPGLPPLPEGAPDMGEDVGAEGDPMDRVGAKIQELDNLVQDLSEAYESLKEESAAGEEGSAEMPEMPKAASLNSMAKVLNGALKKGIKQTIAELKEHSEELSLIDYVYNTQGLVTAQNGEFVNNLTQDALADADKVVANTHKLMSAFVSYADGVEEMVKRASEEVEDELEKLAEGLGSDLDEDTDEDLEALLLGDEEEADDTQHMPAAHPMAHSELPEDLRKAIEGLKQPVKPGLEMKPPQSAGAPYRAPGKKPVHPEFSKPLGEGPGGLELSHADDSADATTVTKPDGTKIELGENVDVDSLMKADDGLSVDASSEPDLSTKEGRNEMRAKLAQKGLQFSDMLDKAHPSGGTTTSLDTKPSDDLAHVEDLEEAHELMMDVANAPPKVKKAAADLQKLVLAGRVSPEKVANSTVPTFDELVAQGLDPAAVKYWKQYYGEAKDSAATQFASDLVREHAEKKQAAEMEAYRVKVARAYDLAYLMAEAGLIASSHGAVAEQVSDIMKWNDESFESMKRMATRQASTLSKTASFPRVGTVESALMSPELPAPPGKDGSEDFVAQLNSALAGAGKRTF